MPYIENRIESGDYLEIIRYSVTENQLKARKRPRAPKTSMTLEKQKRQNIKNAILNMARLMHCNFKHGVDLFVTLTFKDKKNVDEKIATTELDNFFRRMRYFREKNKLPKLKYIWSMGKDKKNGFHFHLVMNNIRLDDLKRIWKRSKRAGRITISDLEYDNTTGLKETARYFIENAMAVEELKPKDSNNIEDFTKNLFKKWSASQNLKKPVIPENYPKVIKSLKINDIPNDYKWYKTLYYETIPTEYGLYQHITLMKYSKMRN